MGCITSAYCLTMIRVYLYHLPRFLSHLLTPLVLRLIGRGQCQSSLILKIIYYLSCSGREQHRIDCAYLATSLDYLVGKLQCKPYGGRWGPVRVACGVDSVREPDSCFLVVG